jgi:hypothetical protein
MDIGPLMSAIELKSAISVATQRLPAGLPSLALDSGILPE